MFRKLILFVCVLLFAVDSQAQAPQIRFLGATSASATGANNIANFNWTIPEGRNRAIIISLTFERDHRATIGQNWPVAKPNGMTYSQILQGTPDSNSNLVLPVIKIGSKSFNKNDWTSAVGNASIWTATSTNTSFDNANFSSMYYAFTLVEGSDGFPTGNVTFDLSGVKRATNSADEALISIEVYENVSRTSPLTFAGGTYLSTRGGGNSGGVSNTTNLTFPITVPTTIPIGRTAAQVGYRGVGSFTQSGITKNISTNGGTNLWQQVSNIEVANNNGTTPVIQSGWDFYPQNEHDGLSMVSALYVGANPTILITRNSNTLIQTFRGRVIALLPTGSPSISGTVYRDTDGNTSINGTPTNAGGSYINIVDPYTGLVVYSAQVGVNGVFSIPQGYVQENISYNLQLSKNQATIGQLPPAVELAGGYTYVGESLGATGNDGASNGILSVDVGLTNISGIRFGVNVCDAGSTAPTVKNIGYSCPQTGADLNTAHTGTTPAKSTLRWFNTNSSSGIPLTNSEIANAPHGTYYAFYYDAVADCYSPVSNAVKVVQICAVNDTYNATGSEGTSGVTFTSTVLTNDSYNGNTPSLGSVNLSVVTPATSIGGGPVPSLSPSTGLVTVPAGTPAGAYTIRYRICDLSGSPCSEATITVNVAQGYCYKLPVKDSNANIPTKHGITSLGRAGIKTSSWPEVRQSSWTVLESKSKGFVVNRVEFAGGNPVGIPVDKFVTGMMVYDTTNNCMKIYNGTIWNCFSTPACPN